jgi:signal transduction histidine kinase
MLFLAIGLGFSYAETRKIQKVLLYKLSQTQTQILQAQETERNRIAQDLHDEIGNALAALKNLVTQNIKTDNLGERISQIAQGVRDISHNLASIDFDKATLSVAFQNLIHRHNEAQNIAYELIEIGIPQKLSPDKALVIYRIACELLNNIHKHSKAKKATVQLIYESQTLTLMVEDDGIGIQTKGNKNEGIGLNHIQTRVAYLNGKLTIDDDGKGTVIIINIPI